jgi:hypothetical protein
MIREARIWATRFDNKSIFCVAHKQWSKPGHLSVFKQQESRPQSTLMNEKENIATDLNHWIQWKAIFSFYLGSLTRPNG